MLTRTHEKQDGGGVRPDPPGPDLLRPDPPDPDLLRSDPPGPDLMPPWTALASRGDDGGSGGGGSGSGPSAPPQQQQQPPEEEPSPQCPICHDTIADRGGQCAMMPCGHQVWRSVWMV